MKKTKPRWVRPKLKDLSIAACKDPADQIIKCKGNPVLYQKNAPRCKVKGVNYS